MKIAYQGIKYSNSYFAAKQIATKMNIHEKVELIGAKTSRGVVKMLSEGTADIGVLAKVNSTMGTVKETKEALRGKSYDVIESLRLPISHCLYTYPGASILDIKTIKSHPQALGQCSNYIETTFPKAKTLSCTDTSQSALDLKTGKDTKTGVICSEQAGEALNLQLLEKDVQNDSDNVTKFVAIENLNEDFTSLVPSLVKFVSKVPVLGALFDLLSTYLSLRGYWMYTVSPGGKGTERLPYNLRRVVRIGFSFKRGIFLDGWTEGNRTKMFSSLKAWGFSSRDGKSVLSYEYNVDSVTSDPIQGYVTIESEETAPYQRVNNLKGKYIGKNHEASGHIYYTRICPRTFERIRSRK